MKLNKLSKYPIIQWFKEMIGVSQKKFEQSGILGNDIDGVLLVHLTPSDTFFDVGANVGRISSLVISTVKMTIAFEPNPIHAAQLRGRLLDNFIVIEEALSNKIERSQFFLDVRPGEGFLASSLMILDDLHESGMVEKIFVETNTLDNYVTQSGNIPTFIKIDVEGYEPEVIEGAKETIRKFKPKILFEMWETHFPRYEDFMIHLSKEYYLVRLESGEEALTYYRRQKGTGVANILALPL